MYINSLQEKLPKVMKGGKGRREEGMGRLERTNKCFWTSRFSTAQMSVLPNSIYSQAFIRILAGYLRYEPADFKVYVEM